MARAVFLPQSYLRHRGQMGSGDLIEWQSDTALGWLIRRFTGKDVNHTSLVIRPSDFSGYRDRRFMLEALEGGITPTLLSERLRHFKGVAYWVPLKPEFDPLRESIKEFAVIVMCQDKPGYGYGDLFKQAFGRVSLDAQRFICSEWAQFVWCYTGVIHYQADALRPGEFDQFGVTLPRVEIYNSRKELLWRTRKRT